MILIIILKQNINTKKHGLYKGIQIVNKKILCKSQSRYVMGNSERLVYSVITSHVFLLSKQHFQARTYFIHYPHSPQRKNKQNLFFFSLIDKVWKNLFSSSLHCKVRKNMRFSFFQSFPQNISTKYYSHCGALPTVVNEHNAVLI